MNTPDNPDPDTRLCWMCLEEYDDEICPCLPVEPPVEEWDVVMDR